MSLEQALAYALIVIGAVLACVVVIYIMRKQEKKVTKPMKEALTEARPQPLPIKLVKTVPQDEAGQAKGELRLLDLEREILSDAIRRLYEAHAEGKITEEEREKIAKSYKSRIMIIKEAITKDESLIALHELETMQEDLIKLFSDRFDELSERIDELRSSVEVKPIKEISIPKIASSKKKPTKEIAKKSRSKEKEPVETSQKTKAEKRIEKIREEVEKVLDRLGQMEVEP